MRSVALVAALAGVAAADDGRPVHGSLGLGPMTVLTGNAGDSQRFAAELDVEPHSRYGALVAWRGFDNDHHGTLAAGLIYEGGAARPRLVVDLHADVGLDLDRTAPMVGGGVRTVLGIVGPLGLALDSGAYLVVDGVEHTALQLAGSAELVARF